MLAEHDGSYAACVTCPKCHGFLRTVDKQGVRLEQCENCRGIFLDHGELEQLLRAEQHYYGGGVAPYVGHSGGHRSHSDSPRGYRDSPRPYREDHHGHYADSPRPYGHRRSHGSFLGGLFG